MNLALTDYQACVAVECLRRERGRCHGSGAEVGAMLKVELMLLQRLPASLAEEIHLRKDMAAWRVYEDRLRRLDEILDDDLPELDPEPDNRPIRISPRWTKRKR